MARSTWLSVAIALAILVPWDQAHAVRVERRGGSVGSPRRRGPSAPRAGATRPGAPGHRRSPVARRGGAWP